MEINVYKDFLSLEEIYFLTGCKQKSRIVEQLNTMGIPFKKNALGYPIVRRDYSASKSKTSKTVNTELQDDSWDSNVLKS